MYPIFYFEKWNYEDFNEQEAVAAASRETWAIGGAAFLPRTV